MRLERVAGVFLDTLRVEMASRQVCVDDEVSRPEDNCKTIATKVKSWF